MLYELIYHSLADNDLTTQEIGDILEKSRQFNGRHSVTGCLLCYQSEFLQILEGEKETVLALYNKIAEDPRHSHLVILGQGEITHRVFEHWTMGFQDYTDYQLNENTSMSIEELTALMKNLSNTTKARKLFSSIAGNLIAGKFT